MKTNYRLLTILFAAVLFCAIAPNLTYAQDRDYAFVVIETTVTRKGVETSDKNPEERRFYISNIVEIPTSDSSLYRNANKAADAYFTKTVVEPLEAQGILHHYYDNDVVINNNGSYVSESREVADENFKKTLDGLKEQNANIFTFTWEYGKEPKGLEMARPTLLVHNSEQPLYGVTETKTTLPPKQNPPKKKN